MITYELTNKELEDKGYEPNNKGYSFNQIDVQIVNQLQL